MLLAFNVGAQSPKNEVDAIGVDSIVKKESVAPIDTTQKSRIRRVKVDLDNQVVFSSQDSIVMTGDNRVYMYGKGAVTYGKLKLDADQIDMDMKNSLVYAVGRKDSLGEWVGKPVFDEGGATYETETMKYNFKSKRGYITNVITEQGEGYLTGGETKKMEDDTYYIKNGRYTTCDQHDCPHFYFQLTQAKVRPNQDIVTGPAYMVLSGLPLPLAVPFGYSHSQKNILRVYWCQHLAKTINEDFICAMGDITLQ